MSSRVKRDSNINPFLGTTFDFATNRVTYYPEDGSVTIMLEKNETLMFRGYMQLCVLKGSVQINGHIMHSKSYDSSQNHAHTQTVTNNNNGNTDGTDDLNDSELNLSRNKYNNTKISNQNDEYMEMDPSNLMNSIDPIDSMDWIENDVNVNNNNNKYYTLFSSPYGNEPCLVIHHHSSSCESNLSQSQRLASKQEIDDMDSYATHSSLCQIHMRPIPRLRKNKHNNKNNNVSIDDTRSDPIFRVNGCYFIYDPKVLLSDPFAKVLNINSKSAAFKRQRRLFNEFPPLFIPQSWRSCMQSIETEINSKNAQKSSVMICAKTQTGKSTFARYAVNSLLNANDKVAYLDIDVGQAEFTPEGIVSLSIVSQPLLGPPFTHQHFASTSDTGSSSKNEDSVCLWKAYYYGENTPSPNASFYLNCVLKLYTQWMLSSDSDTMPLIINTNGWVEGLGAKIMKKLIGAMKPSHLIEIEWQSQLSHVRPLFKSDDMDGIGEIKDMFANTCMAGGRIGNSARKVFDWRESAINPKIDGNDGKSAANYKKSDGKSNESDNLMVSDGEQVVPRRQKSLLHWWRTLIDKTRNDANIQNLPREGPMRVKSELNDNQKRWERYLNDLYGLCCDCMDGVQSGSVGSVQTSFNFGNWYSSEKIDVFDVNCDNWDQLDKAYFREGGEKNSDDFELFYSFFNANVHYVESIQAHYDQMTAKLGYKVDDDDLKNSIDDTKQRESMPLKVTRLRAMRRVTAPHKRALNMIAYFAQKVFLDYDPALYLTQMDCYEVPMESVALSFMNGMGFDGTMILDAVNGTLVGLCCAKLNLEQTQECEIIECAPKKRRKLNSGQSKNVSDHMEHEIGNRRELLNECEGDTIRLNVLKQKAGLQNSDDCLECVGLGIIRGINLKEKLFYLLTPVEPALLNRVDVFARGSTNLSTALLDDANIVMPSLYLNAFIADNKVPQDRVINATC